MNWRVIRIPLILVGLLIASVGRGDDTYPIKLDFPQTVGQKYHLHAHGTSKQQAVTTFKEKATTRTNTLTIDLRAEIEVLEVDAKGLEKKISCTVEKCVMDTGKGKTNLFDEGDVVVAEVVDHKNAYSMSDVEVSREAATALGMVLEAHTSNFTDDDIFGTKEAKKVGETWSINAALALADLNETNSPFVMKNMQGQGQLVGVKPVGGEKCIEIAAAISADIDMQPEPGTKLKESEMKARFGGLFLPSGQRVKEWVSMKSTMKMETKNSKGTASKEVVMERVVEKEFSK